jgi:hypothetical protein
MKTFTEVDARMLFDPEFQRIDKRMRLVGHAPPSTLTLTSMTNQLRLCVPPMGLAMEHDFFAHAARLAMAYNVRSVMAVGLSNIWTESDPEPRPGITVAVAWRDDDGRARSLFNSRAITRDDRGLFIGLEDEGDGPVGDESIALVSLLPTADVPEDVQRKIRSTITVGQTVAVAGSLH